MTRRIVLPVGMAYCSHGRHLAPIADFYIREGGKLASWCKECTTDEAKRSKERKQMVAVLVEKITAQEEEESKDIEKQTIIHSHISKWSNPKVEVLDFPPTTLDWLTPIWGFQERSKLEQ